jgi:hypothetical protein
MAGKEPVEHGRPDIAHMGATRGAGGKTDTNLFSHDEPFSPTT